MSLARRLVRFAQVSVLSFVVNLGLTIFLHEVAGAPEELAFAVAIVAVYFMNFFACRHYIYAGKEGSASTQFTVFVISSIVFRASEYLAFLLFHTQFGIDYRLSVIAILAISSGVKFVYYRFVFEGLRRPTDLL